MRIYLKLDLELHNFTLVIVHDFRNEAVSRLKCALHEQSLELVLGLWVLHRRRIDALLFHPKRIVAFGGKRPPPPQNSAFGGIRFQFHWRL